MFDFAEIRSNLDVRVGRRFLGYAREEGPGREGGERPPGLRFLGSRNFVFAYTYGYGGVSCYMRAVNKEMQNADYGYGMQDSGFWIGKYIAHWEGLSAPRQGLR